MQNIAPAWRRINRRRSKTGGANALCRYASRRLANKMLADIGGDAMIVRTLRAQQSDAAAVLATR